MKRRTAALVSAIVGGVTLGFQTCHAQIQLIGVSWDFVNSPVTLIDPVSGQGTLIGLSGTTRLNSLAQESSGALYSVGGDGRNEVVRIDPLTGMATTIAVLPQGDIRALAFSASDDLYAIKEGKPDGLYRLDPQKGGLTFIGSTGLDGIQALDFSPTGTLYAYDGNGNLTGGGLGLVTIDVNTGRATDVNAGEDGSEELQALVFAPDGTLYAAFDKLYRVDVITGKATLIGAGGYSDVRGLALFREAMSNAPPTVTCSPIIDAECSAQTLLTAEVSDYDPDTLVAVWVVNGVLVQTNTVTPEPSKPETLTLALEDLPLGTNTVTVAVSDSVNPPVECTTFVIVEDTHPPVIGDAVAAPNVLWPPNGKMALVSLSAIAEDSCSSSTWKVHSISCSDADHDASDIRFVGHHEVALRATRSGNTKAGRTYTIWLKAQDTVGNESGLVPVTVTVPHDQRNKTR